MNISAGLIIPSKNAGARWADVIAGICSQQGVDLDVLVVDSGSTDQTLALARDAGFRVMEIPSSEFGHGATRQMALEQFRNHRWVLFMTQDAILCSPTSVLSLLGIFRDRRIALAYGRQVPHENATPAARRLREFNYPEQSNIRSYEDRHLLGLKTAFNSNSFAAYDRARLVSAGGFCLTAAVGEDVLACAALLRAGYCSAYVADATVFHSHNYSLIEEFSRYQSIGAMHATFPDLLRDFGQPEGEGLRLVWREVSEVLRRSPFQLWDVIARSAVRYLGYRLGRMRASKLFSPVSTNSAKP